MYEEPDLYNADCMEAMKEFPDKFFDIAIVDPPYGIKSLDRRKDENASRLRKYGDLSQANNGIPGKEYFDELFRVSKHSIIWGGNYFDLPPCRCFVCWYKHQPVQNYSDCEFAWTDFDKPSKVIDLPYFGATGKDEERIHPTQKPVALYTKLLKIFANEGDKILDTHCGSASSLIAFHRSGIEGWGFEIDRNFYKQAKLRLDRERDQVSIFELI